MTEPLATTTANKFADIDAAAARKRQSVDVLSKTIAVNTRTALLNPDNSTTDFMGNLGLDVADRSLQLVGKVATALPTAINEAGGGREGFTTKEHDLHKSITGKRNESAELSKQYLDPKTPVLQKAYLKSRIAQLSSQNYTDEEVAFLKPGVVDTNVPAWEMTGTTDSRFETIDNYLTNQANINKHSNEYKVIEPLVDRDAVNDVTESISKVGNKEWDNASKGVDKVMEGNLTEGLGDVGSALAEFTGSSLSTIANKPSAVVQLVAESIPDMLLSGASMPVALAAYMTDNVKTAITDFKKANGHMPVGDELTTLYKAASASGVADLLGDKLIGVGGGARKAITSKIAKAIPAKVAQNGLVNAVAKVGGELATSAVGEGIAESSADVLQQYAVKQDTDKLDVGQSLAAGALGAAAGVATVGSIETAKLPSKALKAGTIAAVKHGEKVKVQQAEQAEADKELNSVAATAQKQTEEVLAQGVPEAGKEADFVKDVNEPLREVNKGLSAFRDRMLADEELTEGEMGEMQSLMDTRSKLLAAKKDYEVKGVAPIATVEEGKAAIADVVATPDAKKTDALFFSAAQNPELYTTEDIDTLAQNDNLTEPQKAFVKGFVDYKEALAKVAPKTIGDVHNDVLYGGEGFTGIKEYIETVANALATGDTTFAYGQLELMGSFLESQKAKLVARSHAPDTKTMITSEIAAIDLAHTFLKRSIDDQIVAENAPTEEVVTDATTTEGTEVGSEQSVTTDELPPIPTDVTLQVSEEGAVTVTDADATISKIKRIREDSEGTVAERTKLLADAVSTPEADALVLDTLVNSVPKDKLHTAMQATATANSFSNFIRNPALFKDASPTLQLLMKQSPLGVLANDDTTIEARVRELLVDKYGSDFVLSTEPVPTSARKQVYLKTDEQILADLTTETGPTDIRRALLREADNRGLTVPAVSKQAVPTDEGASAVTPATTVDELVTQVRVAEYSIKEIKRTISRTGDITDKQQNALDKWGKSATEGRKALLDSGQDYATLHKAAITKATTAKVKKILATVGKPNSTTKLAATFSADGTRLNHKDGTNNAPFVVVQTTNKGKYILIDTVNSKLLKRSKTIPQSVDEYIAEVVSPITDESVEANGISEVDGGITEDAAPIEGSMEDVPEPSGPEYTNPAHDNTASVIATVAESATDTTLDRDFDGKKAKDTPLHREPNLFSKLTDTASEAYTKLTGHLNPTQKKALTVVTRFVAANSKAILKNTKATVSRHAMNHTFNDFVTGGKDGAPEIDENVISTIALVNHNWIVANAGATIVNDTATINGLLGRKDKKHHVTDGERKTYQYVGIPLPVLAESLGSDVIKELGMRAKSTANPNAEGQLRTSLGQVAAISLINQGILEQVWVNRDTRSVLHNIDGYERYVAAKHVSNAKKSDIGTRSVWVHSQTGKIVEEAVPENLGFMSQYVLLSRKERQEQGVDIFIGPKGDKKGKLTTNSDIEQVWINPSSKVALDKAPTAVGYERFVRAAVVEETKDFNGKPYTREVLAKSAAYIVKSNKDSDKMLDTMFGIASEAAPIYDNAEDVPAYTVDQSGNPLSGEQADALTKHSKEAHSMKEAQLKVFQSLGLALQADMLGFVIDIEGTKHKDNVLGTEAANEAILRSIDAINELAETHEGKDFFFGHSVAKNKRMHMIKGNGISTQADKLHRHLIKMNSWVTEVDMTKPDSIGAHMFRAAVGEAFGVDVDKNDITKTQKGFEEVIARPKVIAGVAEVKKALAGEPSDSYLIREAVGNGKAFGLDGLVALAQMDMEKPFTTDLFREVDGVTNGVAIGMLQLVGAASYNDARATLARCGIALDNGETSYGAWYNDPANDDSYQDLTKEIIHYFNRVSLATKVGKREVSHEAVNAFVTGLDGFLTNLQDKDGAVSKAGRALSKNPLMQSNYGAGMKAIMESVTADIIDSVTTAIEKANSGATSEQEAAYAKIEANISLLTNHRFKIDRSNPLQTTLSEAVKKDIGFAVNASYGKAMAYAIEEKYGRFQEHARLINNAVGVSFNAFKVMYDDLLSNVTNPTNGDVQNILEMLKPYSPMVATAISNEIAEGGYVEDGVNFVNREKTKSYNGKLTDPNKLSPTNQELVVKSEFVGGGKFKNKGMTSSIYGRSFKEPGVSPAVLLIQSMDASTIVRLMGKHSILNVHDAAGMNMNGAPETSTDFNKGFHDLNKNYSILSAVQDTMNRTLDGYVKLTGDTKFTRVPFDTNGDQVFIESGLSLDVNDFRKTLSQAVEIVNNNREVVFSRMTNMVQYNAELGNYTVSNGATTKEFQTLPDAIRYERDFINEQEDEAPVVSLDAKQKSRLYNMHGFLRAKLTPEQLQMHSSTMSGNYENLIAQVSNNVAFRELLANTPAGKSTVLAVFEEIIGKQPKQKAVPVPDTAEISVLKGLRFQGANAPTRSAIVKDIVSMVKAGLNIDAAFDGAKANWDSKMVESIRKRYSTKYGSSSTQTADAFTDRAQDITSDNVAEIFDTLSKMDSQVDVSIEHQTRLTDVINLAKTVISPLKLLIKEAAGEESVGSLQGDTVFISTNTGALTSKLEMSPQEVYTHEVTHAISRYGIEKFGALRRELIKAFAVAEKHMLVEDLMTGTHAKGTEAYTKELEAATARYNHVFKNKAQRKKTVNEYSGIEGVETHDHSLDEFLTLGSTNQQFIDALSKASKRIPKKHIPKLRDTSLKGWIKSILDTVIDYVSTSITGLRHKPLDAKVQLLLNRIVSAENKQKSKVYQLLSRTGDKVIDTTDDVLKGFASKIGNAVDRPIFKNSKLSIVRTAANVVSGDTDGLVKAMGEFTRKTGLAQKQWAIDLYNEVRGASPDLAKIIQMCVKGSHIIDQARVRIVSHYSKYLTSMYKTKLTKEIAGAVHRTLIKTDMEGLVERYGIAESIKLMHSGANKAIDVHIANLEMQLDNGFPQYAAFYKSMSKGLGHWMATGLSIYKGHQLTNAHQVAHLTGWSVVPRGNFLESVAIIDSLASLHALKATENADRDIAYATMQNEVDYSKINDNNNGYMATIISHREMKAESLKKLFHNNPAQMVKGYAKETFNPHIDVTVADESKQKELEDLGYEQGAEVIHDDGLSVKRKAHYYVLRGGAGTKYMAGAFSTTNITAKGTDLLGINGQSGNIDPSIGAYMDAVLLKAHRAPMISDIAFGRATEVDGTSIMIPIVDEKYNITGYRSVMSEENKRNILERNDDFRNVLGTSFASIQDKTSTKQINSELVDAMYKTYQEEYEEHPEDFVLLSSKSPVAEHRDAFQMLPDDARRKGQHLFKGQGIYVKRTQYTMLFGYRAVSVANLKTTKDPLATGVSRVNQEFRNIIVPIINNKATRATERVWQEIVGTLKDTIVIKSGVVTLDNIASNSVLLKLLGVPIVDIVKDQAIGMRAAMSYQKANFEVFLAKEELKRGSSNTVELNNLINRLENEMRVNPIKKLIDAGLLQTIVEDVDTVEDPYSYKNKIDSFVTGITDKLHPAVSNAGKAFALSHDTKAYQIMRDTAQLSDFASRYTLHKHNMSKKNPMSFEESIADVLDIFINYDIPTNKTIQYMNDMGLVMFTKYYLRVQKIILRTMKDSPAKAMLLYMAQNLLGDIPDITDSAIMGGGNLLNKFNWNPFSLASNMFSTMPVNLLVD